MGTVKIKGTAAGLAIFLVCRQWADQAQELAAKLRLLKTCNGHPVEVFFDVCPDAALLCQLINILHDCGCLCTGMALRNPPVSQRQVRVVDKLLRAGTVYCFDDDVLLLQPVRHPVRIRMKGGMLIVLGQVSGEIWFQDAQGCLIATGLDHARIKISDSEWQILTNSAKVCVYYENQRCKAVSLKEEEEWQG